MSARMTTQTFTLTVPTSAILNANNRHHWRVKADKAMWRPSGAERRAQIETRVAELGTTEADA